MANQRMFLVHVPSGCYVPLGKRMGWGWYDVPKDLSDRIQKLYKMIESQEAEGDQDDFVIAFESDKRLKKNIV